MLDSKRLRVLLEIERGGTLAAAATNLGYTPSAVSQQIRALERELGTAVLERHGRGVMFTEPGKALLRRAEHIVEALNAAEADVMALTDLRAGTLRLGWFSTAGASLVPQAIARFRQMHPAIELDLQEADPEECAQALREGELDLAIVYRFPNDPPFAEDVQLLPLLREQLHIALPPDHRLASRSRLTLAELSDETWIQGGRHGSTLATLPAACREAGFEPTIAFQTDNPLAWLGLVAAGVGIAVIPQLSLPTARPDIVIRGLDAPALSREISVATSDRRYQPPATDAMVHALQEIAAILSATSSITAS